MSPDFDILLMSLGQSILVNGIEKTALVGWADNRDRDTGDVRRGLSVKAKEKWEYRDRVQYQAIVYEIVGVARRLATNEQTIYEYHCLKVENDSKVDEDAELSD